VARSNLFPEIEAPRRTKEFRAAERLANSTVGDPLPAPALELAVPEQPAHGLRIAVVTDTQVRDDVPTDHIPRVGKYLAAKQPDVILCIGDWWDMPSLSDHDALGSLPTEGQRYPNDVDAGRRAMEAMLNPIAKVPGYAPKMVFTLGNHEDRIARAYKNDPRRFTGSVRDLGLEQFGWTVYPFLQPVVINGVVFCHFFPRGVMGRPVQSPAVQLKELHMSSFAGHQQGRQIAYSRRADGGLLTAIISGSCYQHDEGYMPPLSNKHWRGFYMLHEVKNGSFDEMPVSLNFLARKFG
jgi:hypothetical protein